MRRFLVQDDGQAIAQGCEFWDGRCVLVSLAVIGHLEVFIGFRDVEARCEGLQIVWLDEGEE